MLSLSLALLCSTDLHAQSGLSDTTHLEEVSIAVMPLGEMLGEATASVFARGDGSLQRARVASATKTHGEVGFWR